MGVIEFVGDEGLYDHEGWVARLLDDGSEDDEAATNEAGDVVQLTVEALEARVVAFRAACECGWRGETVVARDPLNHDPWGDFDQLGELEVEWLAHLAPYASPLVDEQNIPLGELPRPLAAAIVQYWADSDTSFRCPHCRAVFLDEHCESCHVCGWRAEMGPDPDHEPIVDQPRSAVGPGVEPRAEDWDAHWADEVGAAAGAVTAVINDVAHHDMADGAWVLYDTSDPAAEVERLRGLLDELAAAVEAARSRLRATEARARLSARRSPRRRLG